MLNEQFFSYTNLKDFIMDRPFYTKTPAGCKTGTVHVVTVAWDEIVALKLCTSLANSEVVELSQPSCFKLRFSLHGSHTRSPLLEASVKASAELCVCLCDKLLEAWTMCENYVCVHQLSILVCICVDNVELFGKVLM